MTKQEEAAIYTSMDQNQRILVDMYKSKAKLGLFTLGALSLTGILLVFMGITGIGLGGKKKS